MINECVMIGNLVKDPEKVGNGETLCKFGIAINGYKADDVSFFTMVAFGKLADNILKYCKKGSKVAISCTPHSRVYENKDKQKVYTVEFLVNTCEFLNTRNAADEPQKKEQTDSYMPF